jgi:uncharacterized protein
MEYKARLYDNILSSHIKNERQMVFVTGPRQVGKTTTCRGLCSRYFNWDNIDDRQEILKGTANIARLSGINELSEKPPVILFDELHKNMKWKQFLKGLFDSYGSDVKVMVTGSSRMNMYRRGGDSLMGRYFLYRIHPFSVGELIYPQVSAEKNVIRTPAELDPAEFDALWEYGGYPEPFIKRDPKFSRRWQNLRLMQFLKEDVRDMTQISDLDRLEILAKILIERSGRQIVYSNISKHIQVSVDTVKRWVAILCNLHLGFMIRPYHKNVSRSLRKEPKWFLRDWSLVDDEGARAETFVGCHLLKAVDGYNDLGLGNFELGYLRDKDKREVDFIIVKDGKPWFLIEVKLKKTAISKSLEYFRKETGAPFAFQVVIETDYVNADCFSKPDGSIVVPARTLLSQLL